MKLTALTVSRLFRSFTPEDACHQCKLLAIIRALTWLFGEQPCDVDLVTVMMLMMVVVKMTTTTMLLLSSWLG